MHQTAKGKQWYFGMKAHIGVDSKEKIIHTRKSLAANVADSLALPASAARKRDSGVRRPGVRGQGDVIRKTGAKGEGLHQSTLRYNGQIDETERRKNRTKSKIRSPSGARLLDNQGLFWLHEGSVSRSGEEPSPHAGDLRVGDTCSWFDAGC